MPHKRNYDFETIEKKLVIIKLALEKSKVNYVCVELKIFQSSII